MQLAIDLNGIAENYYKGSVEPIPSSLTSRNMKGWGLPWEEWPQDVKEQYAYKPDLAKKLLAEAGYPHGFKTNIIADTTGDMVLLDIVKQYFKDVGIDMEIRTMESTDWIKYVLTERKHDQLAQRTVSPLGHGYEPIRQLSRLHTGYSSNYLMVSDPVFDAFQPAAIAAPDEQARKKVCATPTNMSPGSISPFPCFHRVRSPSTSRGSKASTASSARFVPPPAAPRCSFSIRPVSGLIKT